MNSLIVIDSLVIARLLHQGSGRVLVFIALIDGILLLVFGVCWLLDFCGLRFEHESEYW